MATGLRIDDIALSPRRRGLPSPLDGRRDIWFDVTISVHNPGAKPLHVVSELRGLAYDAASKVLTLRLAEAAPGPTARDAPTYTLPTPATITVAPRGTAKITLPIPAILREVRQVEGAPLAVDETDLRAMRRIRCEVASSEKPIGAQERTAPHLMRSRVARWGITVTGEAAVTPDTRR